jgi:hypothetical protein
MAKKTEIALALTLFIVGCDDLDRQTSAVRVQVPTATVKPVPSTQPNSTPLNREVKLQVTVDSPADLKIVTGNAVQTGQIISDRYSVKQKLATKRQELSLQLQEIEQSDRATIAAPQLEQAKLEAKAADLDLKEFKASQRWTSTAHEQFPALTEGEARKAKELEERQQQAQIRLKQVEAYLKTAVNQDRQNKSLIAKDIATIDREINKVGVVRSPYSGTIKDIKLVQLPNKEVTAEITINVNVSDRRTPVGRPLVRNFSNPEAIEMS